MNGPLSSLLQRSPHPPQEVHALVLQVQIDLGSLSVYAQPSLCTDDAPKKKGRLKKGRLHILLGRHWTRVGEDVAASAASRPLNEGFLAVMH